MMGKGGQEWAPSLRREQGSRMGPVTWRISQWAGHQLLPRRSAIHCTYVSSSELVVHPRPRGAARSYTAPFTPGVHLPHPQPPVCLSLVTKKSLRERYISYQHHADPLSPPPKP